MEIPSALVAFAVIMGIAYWMNSSREKKERVAANEKAAKAAKVKRDNILRLRNKARRTIRNRAMEEFGVKYTEEELDWILDNSVSHSDVKGLEGIEHMFATAPKEKLEAVMMKIESEHFTHLMDQQGNQRSNTNIDREK